MQTDGGACEALSLLTPIGKLSLIQCELYSAQRARVPPSCAATCSRRRPGTTCTRQQQHLRYVYLSPAHKLSPFLSARLSECVASLILPLHLPGSLTVFQAVIAAIAEKEKARVELPILVRLLSPFFTLAHYITTEIVFH